MSDNIIFESLYIMPLGRPIIKSSIDNISKFRFSSSTTLFLSEQEIKMEQTTKKATICFIRFSFNSHQDCILGANYIIIIQMLIVSITFNIIHSLTFTLHIRNNTKSYFNFWISQRFYICHNRIR